MKTGKWSRRARSPLQFGWLSAPLLVALTASCKPGPAAQADRASEPPAVSPAPSATESQKASPAFGEPLVSPAPIELRYPRSTTPWLGVELRATEQGRAGVEITRVLSGSPADKALLRSGDILLSLGETPAKSPEDVAAWVRAQKSLETFPLTVLRNGQPRLVRAQLEGMPEFEDRMRLSLVNRPAPEIAGVTTFQGEASSLRELRGQVVVLEFWASFCGVCRFLAPRLDAWHRAYRPQGASVVGITFDPPQVGRQVAVRSGMSYILASDVHSRVAKTYLASQLPAVVVIDRKGIVRDAMVGYSEERLQETEKLIETLLRD